MDILSILGLLFAAAAVVGGWIYSGGSIGALFDFSALLIVVGGTFAAAMIQSHISVFAYSLKMLLWAIFPPRLAAQQIIGKIVKWSNIARKEGLLGLENIAETEQDNFVKKGLQLLVDGNEPESIKRVMEVEINAKIQFHRSAANIIESMGRYSLVIGFLAAVVETVQLTGNFTNPEVLSRGIESVLVALMYGFCLSQFIFVPFSKKLNYLVFTQDQIHNMLMEGVLSIAQGENPRNIETKLQGFLQ